MVAAGRDLGSLLTQMKQKPAVVQRALDSHKQSFSISQFAQIKNRQRLGWVGLGGTMAQ